MARKLGGTRILRPSAGSIMELAGRLEQMRAVAEAHTTVGNEEDDMMSSSWSDSSDTEASQLRLAAVRHIRTLS